MKIAVNKNQPLDKFCDSFNLGEVGMKHSNFNIGDMVEITQGFWEDQNSNDIGKIAIIDYTYASKYGGDNHSSFGLVFEDGDSSAWWYPHKLKLIQHNCTHIANSWKFEREKGDSLHSNLDYIFSNLEMVISEKLSASLQAVFSFIGGGSLWGSQGEGFIYQQNAIFVLRLLDLYSKTTNSPSKEDFQVFYSA